MRRATALTLLAGAVFASVGVTLALAAPSPQLMVVDSFEGAVAVDAARANEMLDMHWVTAFVLARERYDDQVVWSDYRTVRRLADDGPWAGYAKLFVGDTSLDKSVGNAVTVSPRIVGVTLNNENMATVRFEVTRTDKRSVAPPVVTRMVATLRYAYGKHQQEDEAGLMNPQGFSVSRYEVVADLTGEVS